MFSTWNHFLHSFRHHNYRCKMFPVFSFFVNYPPSTSSTIFLSILNSRTAFFWRERWRRHCCCCCCLIEPDRIYQIPPKKYKKNSFHSILTLYLSLSLFSYIYYHSKNKQNTQNKVYSMMMMVVTIDCSIQFLIDKIFFDFH